MYILFIGSLAGAATLGAMERNASAKKSKTSVLLCFSALNHYVNPAYIRKKNTRPETSDGKKSSYRVNISKNSLNVVNEKRAHLHVKFSEHTSDLPPHVPLPKPIINPFKELVLKEEVKKNTNGTNKGHIELAHLYLSKLGALEEKATQLQQTELGSQTPKTLRRTSSPTCSSKLTERSSRLRESSLKLRPTGRTSREVEKKPVFHYQPVLLKDPYITPLNKLQIAIKNEEKLEKIDNAARMIEALLEKISLSFHAMDAYSVEIKKKTYFELARKCACKEKAYMYDKVVDAFSQKAIDNATPFLIITAFRNSRDIQELRKIFIPLMWYPLDSEENICQIFDFDIKKFVWDQEKQRWRIGVSDSDSYAYIFSDFVTLDHGLIQREKYGTYYIKKAQLREVLKETITRYLDRRYSFYISCCRPRCVSEYGVGKKEFKF
jgi:hypothetical protein